MKAVRNGGGWPSGVYTEWAEGGVSHGSDPADYYHIRIQAHISEVI